MTIDRLCALAGVSKWDRATWFRDAGLSGSSLLTPHEAEAKTITKCYLERLRRVMPNLDVKVVTVTPAAKPRPSALKPGWDDLGTPRRAYTGDTPKPKQGDLL